MRKEFTLAAVAVVLAFVVVQGAAILQGPSPAAVMKADLTTEEGARSQVAQLPAFPLEAVLSTVFGPLAMAALCYLLVRRLV